MLAKGYHTLQSVIVTITQRLHPTLWRTCRVLANRNRLRIFGCLLQQPDQTVTAVANRLRLPVAVASQYLRALEARSLLVARRKGRYVSYRVSDDERAGAVEALVAALRTVFQREHDPITTVFKLATAFTHPRRVAVVQALAGGARTLQELHDRTDISFPALMRHLAKLEARGLMMRGNGIYVLVPQRAPLPRALATMACE
jgi:DNA-binding transcriptional ArsR family regulator